MPPAVMERFATTMMLTMMVACLPVELTNRRCDDNDDCVNGFSCRNLVCMAGSSCARHDDCGDNEYCAVGACRDNKTNPAVEELLNDDCPSFIGDDSDISVADGQAVQLLATLLPLTKGGVDNRAGHNRLEAIQLATRNLNEAGGVFGRRFVWLSCNSDGDSATANRATEHIADVGIQAVVGEASSSITVAAFNEVARARGMLMVAPSSTSVNLTGLDDDGLLFRTTVSDIRQGQALANHLLANNYQRIAVLASSDIYATTMRTSIRASLCTSYPCTNLDRFTSVEFTSQPTAAQIDSSLDGLDGFDPDVIVIIGQDTEVAPFLAAIPTHAALDAASLLLTDTAKKSAVLSSLPNDLAARIRGTAPAGEPSSAAFNDFVLEMAAVFPGAIDGFAPHAYDAAMVVALAHTALGDVLHPRGHQLAASISRLASAGAPVVRLSGLNDSNVNALQAGVALLHDGEVVDLDGVSGPLDFDSNGDVLGDIELWRRCETASGDVGVSLGVVLSVDDATSVVDENCPSCTLVGCPDGKSCVQDRCE
jgi:ABC-type branched-subunit amino acid transport system substrate-binding protein